MFNNSIKESVLETMDVNLSFPKVERFMDEAFIASVSVSDVYRDGGILYPEASIFAEKALLHFREEVESTGWDKIYPMAEELLDKMVSDIESCVDALDKIHQYLMDTDVESTDRKVLSDQLNRMTLNDTLFVRLISPVENEDYIMEDAMYDFLELIFATYYKIIMCYKEIQEYIRYQM